jgi:DNA-binding LytR/AlgR family response regulator
MKLNCIIVDDEQGAHAVLKNYIERTDFLELVGEGYNAIEAAKLLREQRVDLMFLDINMPEITGLEFVSTLINPPKIILTTAYSEFALEGFEIGAIDYLMKPIPFVRFLKAVNKIETNHQAANIELITQEDNLNFRFKIDGVFKTFELEQICYFQALGNYVKIVTKDKNHLTIMTFTDLEKFLGKNAFIRVHKSFIVPIEAVKNSWDKEKITIGNEEIPVGRSYKAMLHNFLNK